jgi:GT2 family glycosyltransferase
MTSSVMITTKNRATDLRKTFLVLRQLDPPPWEVLITADGCTDDTVQMLKAEKLNGEMKNLRVFVNETGKGSVASRDRMIREATGDLVLALDDDSYPEQLDCLALVSSLFNNRPSLAVATFPQRTDEYPKTMMQTDFGPERLVRSFPNSGAVLRRSAYLQSAGFEPKFFHMYEEPDYALQCVAAGYDILFTPIVTIRHHWTSRERSEIRNHHRHARNEFWSTLLRCPFPFALGMLAWRIFSQLRYAGSRGFDWFVREPVWWWQALGGVPYCIHHRKPLTWAGYRRWLKLT